MGDGRSRQSGFFLGALLLCLAGCASVPGSAESAPARRVLVQGTELAAVSQAVLEVGGEVTHELGIIHAVGALLTPGQIAELETSPAVRRIVEDRKVETMSDPGCDVSGAPDLRFDDKKVYWDLTNHGSADVTIASVTLLWPAANTEFKKIKNDGDEFFRGPLPPVSAVLDGGWRNDPEIPLERHPTFDEGYAWTSSLSEAASVNVWVEQE